ncbi:uncharacterized protein LOC107983936 isoform X4 [Anolis carolinensis]
MTRRREGEGGSAWRPVTLRQEPGSHWPLPGMTVSGRTGENSAAGDSARRPMTPERKAGSHWRQRKEERLCLPVCVGLRSSAAKPRPSMGILPTAAMFGPGGSPPRKRKPLPREAEDERGPGERTSGGASERGGGGYLYPVLLASKGTQSGFTKHTHGKRPIPDSTINKDTQHRQR